MTYSDKPASLLHSGTYHGHKIVIVQDEHLQSLLQY